MTRGRTSIVALLFVVVAALAASACAATAPLALQVGSDTLSRKDFMAELDALAGDPATLQALFGVTSVAGDAPGTYSTQYTSRVLQLHVVDDALQAVVASKGLAVADQDRQAAQAQLTQQFRITGDLAGFSDVIVSILASQQVLSAAVQREVATDAALQALFEQQGGSRAEVACASHILVLAGDGRTAATPAQEAQAKADADAITAQLRGGADFATLARQRSGDTASAATGGSLGCQPRGVYVAAFDDAVWSQPVGAIGTPVKTQFGYHIIRVDERRPVRLDDVREELAGQLQQQVQAQIEEAVGTELAKLTVTVDPRFGSWDSAQVQVVPPEGPALPGGTTGLPVPTPVSP